MDFVRRKYDGLTAIWQSIGSVNQIVAVVDESPEACDNRDCYCRDVCRRRREAYKSVGFVA